MWVPTLRPKNQLTIPAKLVAQLGWSEGEPLEFAVQGGSLVVMPAKRISDAEMKARSARIDGLIERMDAATTDEDRQRMTQVEENLYDEWGLPK